MADLEALSREIAATSDAWVGSGVEALQDGTLLRICVIDRPGDPGTLHGMNRFGCVVRWQKGADMRPNLADPVTVNSLLGAGSVWQSLICNEFTARIADAATFSPDRTEAICRAWIAAYKGDQ